MIKYIISTCMYFYDQNGQYYSNALRLSSTKNGAPMHLSYGCLVVFYVPSTVRWFRDGTSIYCPLPRTWSSIFTLFLPGIEPRAVAWQSISLPLPHANSLSIICCANQMNHGTITIHYGKPQKKGAVVIDWLIHYSAFSTAKAK